MRRRTFLGSALAAGGLVSARAALPVPSFGPKLLLGSELAHELLFTSLRVLPEVLDREGYPFAHRDVTSALRGVLHQ